jgi:hypothetical protein
MNPQSTPKIIVAAVVAVAALAGACTAQASVTSSVWQAQPTQPAIHALQLRGQALNAHYGLGSAATSPAIRALQLRGQALNAHYALGSEATTPAVHALLVRGAGMNGRYVHYDPPAAGPSPDTVDAAAIAHPPVVTSGGSPFPWGDFGIGALGAMALLLCAAMARRTRKTRPAVAA